MHILIANIILHTTTLILYITTLQKGPLHNLPLQTHFKSFTYIRCTTENLKIKILTLSERTKIFLMSENELTTINEYTLNLFDVTLIELNKNQQNIKAIAHHYRKRQHTTLENTSNCSSMPVTTSSNKSPNKTFKKSSTVNKRTLHDIGTNGGPCDKITKL